MTSAGRKANKDYLILLSLKLLLPRKYENAGRHSKSFI